MDGSSFDRITRRLAVTTTRRGGVAALVAGALGIAGISAAEAVVPVPPVCRSTNMECTDGAQCCSGRCIAKRLKSGGGSRCARKTSNRKKKEEDKTRCSPLQGECKDALDCCESSDSYMPALCGENNDGNVACCRPGGGECKQDADCCAPVPCIGGICQYQPGPVY